VLQVVVVLSLTGPAPAADDDVVVVGETSSADSKRAKYGQIPPDSDGSLTLYGAFGVKEYKRVSVDADLVVQATN